jgi:hypothetical protein
LWAILRWNRLGTLNISPTTENRPSYAQRMVQQGYVRDHTSNRWYSYWAIFQDRCRLIGGTADDATLECEKPLDPRLGLPNTDETP